MERLISDNLMTHFQIMTLSIFLSRWQNVSTTSDAGKLYLHGLELYPTQAAQITNSYTLDSMPVYYAEFYICPELFAAGCTKFWNLLIPWGIIKTERARTRKSSMGRILKMGSHPEFYEREIRLPSPTDDHQFPMPDGFAVLSLLFKSKAARALIYRERIKEIKKWFYSKIDEFESDDVQLSVSTDWDNLLNAPDYFCLMKRCSELELELTHSLTVFGSLHPSESLQVSNEVDVPIQNDFYPKVGNHSNNETELENSDISTSMVSDKRIDDVSNFLKQQLKRIQTAKKERFKTFEGIANSKNGAENSAQLLLDCREEDAKVGQGLFRLLIPLLMSGKEMKRVATQQNSKVWERLLNMEVVPASDYIGHYNEDPGNIELAAKMDIVQSCCDMVCHIMINCRSKGQTPSEWIFAISTLLKTGRVNGAVLDIFNKFHLTVANSTAINLIDEGLKEYYADRFKRLIKDIQSDNGIHIVMFDNYAKLKWATEYVTKGNTFTRITDSTTIMSLKRLRIDGLLTQPDRPRACCLVTDDEINSVLETLLSRNCETELRGLLFNTNTDGSINLLDPIIDNRFTHLVDFQNIASLPCKSGSHEEMLQFMKILLLDLFEGDKREILCPNDPQFSLEVLRYAVTVPDSMANIVMTIAPFHAQKHAIESLGRQSIFLYLLKAPLLKYIGTKPSIFDELVEKFDNLPHHTPPSQPKAAALELANGTLIPDSYRLPTRAEYRMGPKLDARIQILWEADFSGPIRYCPATVKRLPTYEDPKYFLVYDEDPERYYEDELGDNVVWLRFDDGLQRIEIDEEEEDFDDHEHQNLNEDLEVDDELEEDDDIQLAQNATNNERFMNDDEIEGEVLLAFRLANAKRRDTNLSDNTAIATLTGMVTRWKRKMAQAREDRWWKFLSPKEKSALKKEGNGKPQINQAYASSIELEDVLVKASVMNHQREKISFELLYFAFMDIMPVIIEESLFTSSSLGRLIENLFEQLSLCTAPFNSLNNKGNIEPLLRLYPQLIKLYAVGNKPNIVKTGFFLQAQLHHMIDKRPDLVKQIGKVCTSLNEVFIEHNNSVIARNLVGLMVTFPTIRNTSVLIEKKRQQREDLKKLCHRSNESGYDQLKRTSISINPQENMSEVRRQVSRFGEHGSLGVLVKDISVNFLLPLLRKYSTLKCSELQEQLVNEYRPLENISERLKEAAIDIKKYVANQKKLEARRTQKNQAPVQDEAFTVLTAFLHDQTAATLKQILSILQLRPKTYEHLLRQFKTDKDLRASTKGLKMNQVRALACMFKEPVDPKAAIFNDHEAVHRIQDFCKTLRISLRKARPFDPRNPPKQKPPIRPLEEVLKSCPSKSKSLEILGSLDWNHENIFPFQ